LKITHSSAVLTDNDLRNTTNSRVLDAIPWWVILHAGSR
jgi:hypothetical protein